MQGMKSEKKRVNKKILANGPLTSLKGTNVRFLPSCNASRTPNLEFAAVCIRVVGAANTGVGDGRESTGAWLGL